MEHICSQNQNSFKYKLQTKKIIGKRKNQNRYLTPYLDAILVYLSALIFARTMGGVFSASPGAAKSSYKRETAPKRIAQMV